MYLPSFQQCDNIYHLWLVGSIPTHTLPILYLLIYLYLVRLPKCVSIAVDSQISSPWTHHGAYWTGETGDKVYLLFPSVFN